MAFHHHLILCIRLPAIALLLEMAFILLFCFFASYDNQEDLAIYPAFQDVNVMVIFGYSFLLAAMKRYSFSGAAFGLFLTALGVQWAVLMNGFLFHVAGEKMTINLHSILTALMSVSAVLVSAGAALGKANLTQLTWMAVVEVTVFTANRWVAMEILKIESHASLMHVHMFGAYFGLVVASVLGQHSSLSPIVEKKRSASVSTILAMLGTLFLWMFWPSFNSVLIENEAKRRLAVCNTYFALASSTVAAFSLSLATSRYGQLSMAHIHSATLAGGIAVGFSAPIIQHPWIAIILGLGAGTISVFGLAFLQKRWEPPLKISDTCGVHYTFALPSLFGGIVHIILIMANNRRPISVLGYAALVECGALSLSIATAMAAGFITGCLLARKLWKAPSETQYFDDIYWEFPPIATEY